ncbi:MlaD family protein [Nocardia pseudobrasiliensis]|uniref:Phospholipid/cholesterol/gamma-HCH transport system substrate-binding protein n=1 Tax=Nocardia pseudobrasiliensis TaxID=45979 RepID=A0A370IB65_9NOCA|nr:MlaD family protein [Nocardia pseudobrasiliensis]RDI67947.1 phospholipid/cholesterol/gamma-HCH transport system substrate-binding protein [Nocardia pseudobrasiliensis]
MSRRLLPLLALAAALLLSACGIRATDIPIPGTYPSGPHYRLRIEFGSVLNLPDRAKVIADGVDVGMLDHIDLLGEIAVATVDLRPDVQLPVGTTAELRQSTILGDIHIALDAPRDAGAVFLRDGDTIPLAHTLPAANVEDILRALSNIVTGGQVGKLQDVIRSLDSAFPTDPADLDRIVATGRAALRDMASRTGDLDRILAGAAAVATTLDQHRDGVDRTLALGPDRAAGLADVLFGVVQLIVDSRDLADLVGELALPLVGDLHTILDVLAPALRTIATADITVARNTAALDQLLRDRLIPFFATGAGVDATTRSDELIQVLHAMGMVR